MASASQGTSGTAGLLDGLSNTMGPFTVESNGILYMLVAACRQLCLFPLDEGTCRDSEKKLTEEMLFCSSRPKQLHCDLGQQFQVRLITQS